LDDPPNNRAEGPSLIQSISRYWWLVALTTLIAALVAFGWSSRQPVRYEGVVQVFLDEGGEQAADPGRVVRSQAKFLTSPAVLDRVVTLAGGGLTRRELEQRLVVEPANDADLITIRVLDGTAQGAARLADLVVRSYQEAAAEQAEETARRTVAALEQAKRRLEAEIATVGDRLRGDRGNPRLQASLQAKGQQMQTLANRTEEARFEAIRAARTATPQEQAVVPDVPAQPHPKRTAAVGALLGLVGGAGLAWWLTVRPSVAARMPVLGMPGRSEGGRGERRLRLGDELRQARARRDLVALAPNGSATDGAQQVGIVDFNRLTTSIDQVFDSLEGPRQHLYDRDIPQISTDEVASRFPVDFVALLLDDGGGLRVKGKAGLPADRMRTAGSHDPDAAAKLLGGGPRLVSQRDRGRLDAAGMPGDDAEALVLVPLVHDEVAFGVLLAGQWRTNGQADALDNRQLHEIATCAQQLTPYLRAWLRLRHLKHRLGPLQ
jgi:capsular polysaccharide biosynthesis protein